MGFLSKYRFPINTQFMLAYCFRTTSRKPFYFIKISQKKRHDNKATLIILNISGY